MFPYLMGLSVLLGLKAKVALLLSVRLDVGCPLSGTDPRHFLNENLKIN